ncbi:MOSC N-terminal beta barrel domain-containing protein [Spongiibacter nanhainus]|uniref:MOSC N-terminal beta barrel domain-containing protein n=1 Tax=Spongiibacter nanhainus TaxID=2794344 RepID=A0A7T4UQJ4_9GAMM|nr:MOSC N-terminal beta barrel domain-containing protein [Spongiibacter nanhainus]QQD18813.1 MOSC N-terminal beta barrel domain-containing protein [Spongiibacter nanhainus]
MNKVGHIASIWHYPVKGMAGSMMSEAEVDERGIEGDRLWAVRDVQRQEIQSCKFRPQLLQCRASYASPDMTVVNITFPSGERLQCGDSEANELISTLVGHPSELRHLEPASNEAFYRRYKQGDEHWLDELKNTFAREPGEPLPDLDNLPQEMQEYVSQLGTFFLVSPLHILTTASLKHMHSLNPEADWHVERFRPNIVIETEPGITGLAEQDWVGSTLRIGSTEIQCHDTAPRCGAVVRKQQGIEEDRSILRSIVSKADQNLGIYGNNVIAGSIRVGDAVYLV